MLNIFRRNKSKGKVLVLKVKGMHCISCSMNIDGALENLDGVISSKTSYAKGQAKVEFDPKNISENKIKATLKDLGYSLK